MGGAAGIVGHLEIADKVTIGAMSLVTHSLDEPGEYASGTPLQPKRDWRKNARIANIDTDQLNDVTYVTSLLKLMITANEQLPIVGGRPFMTYAMRDQFTGQPPYGLMDVLQATFHVVPEAVQGALTAAQTIDLAAKQAAAQRHINATVAAAAGAAAVPIPFSSAALLVPMQLAMMGRIAHLYKVPFDRAALLAAASTGIATSLGRTAAANLLKFIPGAGSIAGGVINASVASGFTLAMGQSWLTVCQRAAAGKLPTTVEGVIDSAAVKHLFEEEFRKRMPTIRKKDEQ